MVICDEAVKAMNEKCYDAVGFALTENMFLQDIDHMDKADPFVLIHIDRLDTYTERSYSGTRFHSHGLMNASKIPAYEKDGKRELEQSQACISELDEIIQRLYEDNIK